MSGSALLELTADSNALLGTSHNLSHLHRLHSVKAQQQLNRQHHQLLHSAQQRLHAADRSAHTALLHHAGLHADVASPPSSIARRGDWTSHDRHTLRTLTQQPPHSPPPHHKRRRDDSDDEAEGQGEEEGDSNAGDLTHSTASPSFDELYGVAQRMGRPVWEVMEHRLRQRSTTLLPLPPPPPSSLSLEEAESFSRHIAGQFDASYQPPPPPLLPPSLPTVKRRGGDGRGGQHVERRKQFLSAIFAASDEEDVDDGSDEEDEEEEEEDDEEEEEEEEDDGTVSDSSEEVVLSHRLQNKRKALT